MVDAETEATDDASSLLVEELAPCRAAIASVMADLRSIQEKHPKVHNLLFDVNGMLEEVDSLLEDAPNNYDVPNSYKPEVG
jgi:hypothetical protein